MFDMEIQCSPYILVNCYAPNNEQEQIKLFQAIRDQLKKLEPDKDVNIILRGDCNLILNSSLDAFGERTILKSNSLKQLYDLMSEFYFIEIKRIWNTSLRQFLWRRKRPEMKIRRLDFSWFRTCCSLRSKPVSLLQRDHSPVVLKLRSAYSAERGEVRGYWKFNNWLLNDAGFVTGMNEFISQVIKNFKSIKKFKLLGEPRVNWEFLKCKIRRKVTKTFPILSPSSGKKEKKN